MMLSSSSPRSAWRDRLVILGTLLAITLIAWAYLVWLASTLQMTEHHSMAAPRLAQWSAVDAIAMLLMWSVMMIGMMFPSVTPMILMYARVARHASARETPFAATSWFASGYVLSWLAFALAATSLQYTLELASLVSPMSGTASATLGGVLMIIAGVYQFTALKRACLDQCQSPLLFIQRHGGFRAEPGAATMLGLRHGAYCIGCCWSLMLLLFVAGVMNLLWVAGIAAVVLIEKLIPSSKFQQCTGAVFMVTGAAMLLATLF